MVYLLAPGDYAAAGPSQDHRVVFVDNARALTAEVNKANKNGGNVSIRLARGVYSLRRGIEIRAPGISLVGATADPADTVVEGDEMGPHAGVGNVITVSASHFVLESITVQKARFHAVQVKGERGADHVALRNCVLRDSYQQLLKVTQDRSRGDSSSDHGLVEHCLFEFSAGIGPQYYIGGIDAHGARNWVVRGNVFRYIISPGKSVAEYAVHFWNGSAGNLVEQNLIIDCDRGIGFGLGTRGNVAGIIRRNVIYHSAENGQFADVGIAVHSSPGTEIYENIVHQEHDYPNAIEIRFPESTSVSVRANLINRKIAGQRGAQAEQALNHHSTGVIDTIIPFPGSARRGPPG